MRGKITVGRVICSLCVVVLFSACSDGSVVAPGYTDTRGPDFALQAGQLESRRVDGKVEYVFVVTNPNSEAVRVYLSLAFDVLEAEYFVNEEPVTHGFPNSDSDMADSGFRLMASGTEDDSKTVRILFTEQQSSAVEQTVSDRAVVMSVRDEQGNARDENTMVLFEPDLTLGVPTVTSSRVPQNGRFVLSVPVINNGHVANSEHFRLSYHISSQNPDEVISPTETHVATETVSLIHPDQRQVYSVALDAPEDVGTYYYGACVSGYSGEVDKSNNCSAVVSVEVDAQATVSTAPDFVVQTLALSSGATSATLAPGEQFTLEATVRNQGTASGSGTLWYLQSGVRSISAFYPRKGEQAISMLEKETTSEAYTLTVTAPQAGGVYYYGACIVRAIGEVEIGNNCSSAVVSITVNAPKIRVALAQKTFAGRVGQEFTVNARVQNIGTAALDSGADLHIMSSDNLTIGSNDTKVSTSTLTEVRAQEHAEQTIVLPKRTSAGSYYFGVCVEHASVFFCSAGIEVTITNPFIGGIWSGSNSGATITNTYKANTFMTSFNAPVIGTKNYSCNIEYDFSSYRIFDCTGDRTYVGDVQGTFTYRLDDGLRTVSVSGNGRTTTFTRSGN